MVPILTVITATFNRVNYLRECIESVKKSIYDGIFELEHVVFDDGSTDDTEKMCKSYKHLKYFRRQENKGVASARNEAIARSTGQYIFVLDSDDVVLQRSLVNLYKSLKRSSSRWIYSDFLRVNNDIKYLMNEDYYGWEFENVNQMLASIFAGKHFIQHNVLFEKKLFCEVGGYDETMLMAEDLDLFIRFLLKGEMCAYIPIISHLHRVHDNNMSKNYNQIHHQKECEKLKIKYNWYNN